MTLAILRAQLQSMRMVRAGGSRRASIVSLLTSLAWYGFWCLVAFATYEVMAGSGGDRELLLRGWLLMVAVYWQLMPVLTISLGASLDFRKLLLYPIPHDRLFRVEVLLRVVAGAEMLLVLAGGAAGWLANSAPGGPAAWWRVAIALPLFVMFNALLGSGLRGLLERVLARGRVREVVVLLLILLGMLPRFLILKGVNLSWVKQLAVLREDGLPWTLAAHALMGHRAAVAIAGLLAWSALAALFGRWQFERGLRFDSLAAAAGNSLPRRKWIRDCLEHAYRLPALILPDPLAALVEKELRTLARAPRFRMVFVMGFSFGLLVWLPLVAGPNAAQDSALSRNFVVVVSVYALTLLGQVSYWNSFGFDGRASQIYFLAPLAPGRLVAAKNITALLFVYLESAVLVAVTLAAGVQLTWARVGESTVVITICAFYMLGLGNIASVHYPRGMNAERVSQGGSASRLHSMLMLLYPLVLLPVFLAYAARYMLRSDMVFWLLTGLAGLIGIVFYWIAVDSAVEALSTRRERFLDEVALGEGPVVSR